jgi:predicted RNA-binding protein YlxR (DUF448 family)/ribosomal protein L30E
MEIEDELADRMCIVTREVMDEDQLIRFVRGPQGEAVPDIHRKLPGRGVWVGLAKSRVLEASKKKLFSRGLKAETQAPEGLSELVGELLRNSALSYLSLAKKAGEAVAGFSKVEGMLGREKARLLMHAREAAEDGKRKLAQLTGLGVETICLFTMAELDLALGRSHVVHAAVAKGGLAEKLLAAARRVEAYEAS